MMRTLALATLAAALLAFGGCKDDDKYGRLPAPQTSYTHESPEEAATAPTTRYPARAEAPAPAGAPTEGTTAEAADRTAETPPGEAGPIGAVARPGERVTVEMMTRMGKQMEDLGVPTATVTIAPTDSAGRPALKGEAMLGELEDGVHVMVAVTGLPEGEHAVRIVDADDCAEAAQAPTRAQTQAGATDTLDVDDEGTGTVMFTVPDAALTAGKGGSLVGKAIVIAAEDAAEEDKDQPGAAGTVAAELVACGVIGAVPGR